MRNAGPLLPRKDAVSRRRGAGILEGVAFQGRAVLTGRFGCAGNNHGRRAEPCALWITGHIVVIEGIAQDSRALRGVDNGQRKSHHVEGVVVDVDLSATSHRADNAEVQFSHIRSIHFERAQNALIVGTATRSWLHEYAGYSI